MMAFAVLLICFKCLLENQLVHIICNDLSVIKIVTKGYIDEMLH